MFATCKTGLGLKQSIEQTSAYLESHHTHTTQVHNTTHPNTKQQKIHSIPPPRLLGRLPDCAIHQILLFLAMEGGDTTSNGGGEWLRPMDTEQLRECGHRMVDFVADYYKSIESFPVLSQPGYLKELLPDSAPRQPDTLDSLFNDIRQKIIPGVTHWQSPNYFAYYPSNSSTAGFLGEMLSAAFNIVGFSWITSPAATELEVIVLDWFAKMLQLPSQFLSNALGGGVIQGTASEAVLVALLAARDRALKKHGKQSLEKLVVYASDQTHSALQKACQIAGIFSENFRVVIADCDNNYAVSPEAVSEALSMDLSSGLIPFFICATVGTTSSSAVDPLPELGQIAKAHDMWFHIDAAYAGSACICPEYRHHLNGVEEADSFNMNAHKWFLTNFDCSLLWVKVLSGKFVLRFAVGAPLTEEQHVDAAWKLLQNEASKVLGSM
uniref:Tyrosine decarboxylase n=1 Tax=Leersia perrieri TaxID=77586 RepID=A0A0D9WYA1_9ORYZ